jgi:hypothetical protein
MPLADIFDFKIFFISRAMCAVAPALDLSNVGVSTTKEISTKMIAFLHLLAQASKALVQEL